MHGCSGPGFCARKSTGFRAREGQPGPTILLLADARLHPRTKGGTMPDRFPEDVAALCNHAGIDSSRYRDFATQRNVSAAVERPNDTDRSADTAIESSAEKHEQAAPRQKSLSPPSRTSSRSPMYR
jgi:hypothetical protein